MADESASGRTFRNPLYHRPFADPMVLKFNGRYYAYGTPGTGALPVLRSTDLVTWEEAGEVLEAPEAGLAHWAPEVAYDNGRFFLYYSTGGHEGQDQQLRMAVATSPTGPFDTSPGLLDPDDPFTIDAHPFQDDDGQWYLFYSRDFLEGEPVGTGIVVDRLVGMTSLAGERETVLRPHAEWHLYERQRRWYDRVWDWYTVEGPFVRKHDGRYWLFYSGGAWKAENYGISSAVADHPMGPYEPVVAEDTADVLRTVAGKVIGPGHGSVAFGPDNVAEYLVYHAWDLDHTGRFLHVDPLAWDGGTARSPGPRVEPQPCPPEPLFRDFFDERSGVGRQETPWRLHGGGEVAAHQLEVDGRGSAATAVLDLPVPDSYLLEVNLAMDDRTGGQSRAGVVFGYDDDDNHAAVFLDPGQRELRWQVLRDGEVETGGVLGRLRTDFAAHASHQLTLCRTATGAAVMLDGVSTGSVPAGVPTAGRLGVTADQVRVTVAGVALTELKTST